MTDAPPTFDSIFRADLLRLFHSRRDVRRFRPDPVDEALFQELLEAAWLAPSVGLSQPWRFVTVDDPARRAAIRANFASCNREALAAQQGAQAGLYAQLKLAGLDQAPRHLAVFADPEPVQGYGLGRRTMPETVVYSAVIAVHTLWLAARAAGLGLGWVSILDPAQVGAALDVDADWTFVAYLCLGYPEADSATPELERAGWERRRNPAERAILRR
jgi:5,6-dimethylbenzimidazole synthase